MVSIVNVRQLRHAREVDRAYVSGGGPGNPPHGPFVLTINNYGRTPATLLEYAIEFCEFDAIPDQPAYLAKNYPRTRLRGVYPPQTHAREVDRIEYQGRNLRDPVAYGRFWYEDVWNKPHYASFILCLPPRQLPANISPAYTEWN